MSTPTANRILVPVNFSPCSRAALTYALGLAEKLNAEVEVLHVWTFPSLSGDVLIQVPGRASYPLSQFAREEAVKEMEAFLAETKWPDGVSLKSRLECGHPFDIIQAAAQHLTKQTLIVMGTNGRTGLAHLLMGSVAERVVRHAPCPVLTVRLPEKGNPAGLE